MENQEAKPTIRATVGNLTDHLVSYGETYLKLGVVRATQKATDVAANSLGGATLAVLCAFTLIFISLGVALWLGDIWANPVAGYFAVAGFYLVCALIFIALRKKVIIPYLRDLLIPKDE